MPSNVLGASWLMRTFHLARVARRGYSKAAPNRSAKMPDHTSRPVLFCLICCQAHTAVTPAATLINNHTCIYTLKTVFIRPMVPSTIKNSTKNVRPKAEAIKIITMRTAGEICLRRPSKPESRINMRTRGATQYSKSHNASSKKRKTMVAINRGKAAVSIAFMPS